MKKLFLALTVFIIASSFNVPSCKKEQSNTTTINVIVFESGATVTFTGEQGQGIYVFDEYTSIHNIPDTGTYEICASFGGGCGGFRVSTDHQNLILVGPEGGTECKSGQILVTQYYASVNCE